MLFNSIEFIIFLPVAFVLYWTVFNKSSRMQNTYLFVISFIFYGWCDWRLLTILLGSSIFSWIDGKLIFNFRSDKSKSFWLSALNVFLSTLLLFLFKYYNFFAESFVRCFHICENSHVLLKLVLPVGMSFYLFKAMGYTIDIYNGKIEPEKRILNYLAYMSFFPQILSGPIERPGNLLPQFAKKRIIDYDLAADGCRQVLWGFFKKCVVADSCALYVDRVFDAYCTMNASTLLVAIAVYAIQIYADFSGYSDIAIGVSKLLGFRTQQNFNLPYFSRSIVEFWRRWHISLTSWFTDYIYIPLGGSRCSKPRIIFNTFVVFLISGLWHGANWTFIAWGAYHALLYIPIIISGNRKKKSDVIASSTVLPSLREFGQMVKVFALTLPGWVFFRSENLNQSFAYFRAILDKSVFSVPWLMSKDYYLPIVLSVFLMILVEWRHRKETTVFYLKISSRFARYAAYIILCVVTGFFFFYHLNVGDNFIYMRF